MFEMSIHATDGKVLKRLELSGQRALRIGRSKECDIRIPIPVVSRLHAEIAPLDEDAVDWVIRDLGSTHGCRVNGHKIHERPIQDELEVHIGPIKLRFESLANRIGAELDAILDEEEDAEPAESTVRIIGTKAPPLDETLQ